MNAVKKTLLGLIVVVCIMCYPTTVLAHPVTFKGGYALTTELTEKRQAVELGYTFTQKDSLALSLIGLDARVDGEDETLRFILPRFNTRLYRKNSLESQTNLYLSLGLGAVEQENRFDLATVLSAQADYETRRVYTLLSGETLQSEGNRDFYKARYRFGVAPYVANYEQVHTWLIGQVEYSTAEDKERWSVTPLVRLFYKTYLLEFGVSTRGKFFITGMLHF